MSGRFVEYSGLRMVRSHSRFLQFLLAFELLYPQSYAYPLTSRSNHTLEEILRKRTPSPESSYASDPTFAILGVGAVGDGIVHPRLEVRKLEQNADQWNVFLLGLRRFMDVNQSDPLSYYQISGEWEPNPFVYEIWARHTAIV